MQAFSPDGREVDAGVRRRMERLIQEAASRRMIVVAGIFYQAQACASTRNGPWLESREGISTSAETVTRQAQPFDNVIVNVVNEFNVGSWARLPLPGQHRGRRGRVRRCRQAGRSHGAWWEGAVCISLLTRGNVPLSTRPELDLVLFDWHGTSEEAVAAYRAAGSDKPLMNVEVFGGQGQGFAEVDDGPAPGQNLSWPGWGRSTPRQAPPGRRRLQGVFPPGRIEGTHKGKQDFLAEVAFAARTPGFSLFGHFPGWYQGPSRDASFDNRFDLGGQGTPEDPGIRWYFKAVAQARADRPQARADIPKEEQARR